MEDLDIEITSFTTTQIKCPCGRTRFQLPNAKNGDKTTCGFCGREFKIVIKVLVSKPNKKRIIHPPRELE